MSRLFAAIGSILLACQLALAGSADLFLCLCVGDDLHDTPCQPEPVGEYHDCHDIVIEGSELEWLQSDPPSLLKAPGCVAVLEAASELPAPARVSQLPGYPRSPPGVAFAAAIYSKTIQLLL